MLHCIPTTHSLSILTPKGQHLLCLPYKWHYAYSHYIYQHNRDTIITIEGFSVFPLLRPSHVCSVKNPYYIHVSPLYGESVKDVDSC